MVVSPIFLARLFRVKRIPEIIVHSSNQLTKCDFSECVEPTSIARHGTKHKKDAGEDVRNEGIDTKRVGDT